MRFFVSPHTILGITVAGFVVPGVGFATESPHTQGVSVGHRPVLTNLLLGTGKGAGNGVITDPGASFGVGDTISLMSATVVDADGDKDKAGAYCVWYKIPAGGGTPVLVKDPGPADRNCEYTIQAGDVGFHIQNIIKVYSDPDSAVAKGYTINPVDSVATEVLSASAVVAPYIKGLRPKKRSDMLSPQWTHNESDGFPSTGYAGAEFQMLIDNGTGTLINNLYTWTSSNATEMSVDANGNITLIKAPSGELSVTATPGTAGTALTYRFRVRDWFVSYGSKASFAEVNRWGTGTCVTSLGGTGLATVAQLTPAKKLNEFVSGSSMGSLYGEWGSTGSSLFPPNALEFHTDTKQVNMSYGHFFDLQSLSANGMCHISL